MAEREEYVMTFDVTMYACQEQRWDSQNYPYWETVSRWETAEQAYDNFNKSIVRTPPKRRIVKQSLEATQTGRICITDGLVVFDENSAWHPRYDPRTNDPEWSTYIRLKEKFDA